MKQIPENRLAAVTGGSFYRPALGGMPGAWRPDQVLTAPADEPGRALTEDVVMARLSPDLLALIRGEVA